MYRLGVVAFCVALLAGPAAAAPDGFRESARLTGIARTITSGQQSIYCARSDAAWNNLLTPLGVSPSDLSGYVPSTDDQAYLDVKTCRRLEGWLRGKNIPTLAELGYSALTLVHETLHMTGLDDEGETDCAALALLPKVLRTGFGIRKAATLRAVMNAAWAKHRVQPPEYAGSCG